MWGSPEDRRATVDVLLGFLPVGLLMLDVWLRDRDDPLSDVQGFLALLFGGPMLGLLPFMAAAWLHRTGLRTPGEVLAGMLRRQSRARGCSTC